MQILDYMFVVSNGKRKTPQVNRHNAIFLRSIETDTLIISHEFQSLYLVGGSMFLNTSFIIPYSSAIVFLNSAAGL